MAESKEEHAKKLHDEYVAAHPPKTKGDSTDDGKTKTAKRGRPKKTNEDRHQEEIDTGRRTAGRPGTGNFLGGREAKSKPRSESPGVSAPTPPDPQKLANQVMAGAGGAGSALSAMPPMAPPMPNGRQATLTKVLAASGNPPAEVSNRAPGWAQWATSSQSPFSILGPLDPAAAPTPAPDVGMQTAGAAPAPTKVKTVSIPPAGRAPSDSAAPSPKMPTSSAERASGEKKKKPKVNEKDKLADRISKDNVGANDYYEQLKRGTFNLSK